VKQKNELQEKLDNDVAGYKKKINELIEFNKQYEVEDYKLYDYRDIWEDYNKINEEEKIRRFYEKVIYFENDILKLKFGGNSGEIMFDYNFFKNLDKEEYKIENMYDVYPLLNHKSFNNKTNIIKVSKLK
jgi:hypothetical protein